jgi:hypothetical protein
VDATEAAAVDRSSPGTSADQERAGLPAVPAGPEASAFLTLSNSEPAGRSGPDPATPPSTGPASCCDASSCPAPDDPVRSPSVEPAATTTDSRVSEPSAGGVREAVAGGSWIRVGAEDASGGAGVVPGAAVRGVTRTRAGLPMTPKVDGVGSWRISTSTWSERRPSSAAAAVTAASTDLALASAWATRLALSGRAAARPPVAAGALTTGLP